MNDIEVGTRVFAVLEADDNKVRSFGVGTFIGNQPCHDLCEQQGGLKHVRDTLLEVVKADQKLPLRETKVFQLYEQMLELFKAKDVPLPLDTPDEEEVLKTIREAREMPIANNVLATLMIQFNNPLILLDTGKIVWGMQCWWGPESSYDIWVGGREVELVEGYDQWESPEEKEEGVRMLGGDPSRKLVPGSKVITATCGHKISVSQNNMDVMSAFKPEMVTSICGACLLNDLDKLESTLFSGDVRLSPGQLEELEQISPAAAEYARNLSGGQTFTDEDYERYARTE